MSLIYQELLVNIGCFVVIELIIGCLVVAYFKRKGENLATKQDVQEITRLTEEVQKEFKEGFEVFSSDVHFKYEFYFKQYSELYSTLYGIVMQSEYVRKFVEMQSGEKHPFEEAPFVQVSKTEKTKMQLNLTKGRIKPARVETQHIATPVSDYNKKYLCDCIIEKAEYATQDLLKLAVSYRFVDCYFGNPEEIYPEVEVLAREQEVHLIKEIVQCVVRDYNFLRKELKIDYSDEELQSGIPKLTH